MPRGFKLPAPKAAKLPRCQERTTAGYPCRLPAGHQPPRHKALYSGVVSYKKQAPPRQPACLIAMGCLCALHARGGSVAEGCDAQE